MDLLYMVMFKKFPSPLSRIIIRSSQGHFILVNLHWRTGPRWHMSHFFLAVDCLHICDSWYGCWATDIEFVYFVLSFKNRNGIQQRRNSWQDGVYGTNCPIRPGKNFTYILQVKDQIGSYFYFPSFGFQKAAGGFGGFRIWSRPGIPVPFPSPAGDFTLLAGDWFKTNHYVSISTWACSAETEQNLDVIPLSCFTYLVSLSIYGGIPLVYRYWDDSWTAVATFHYLMGFSSMVVAGMVTHLLLIKVSIY